MKFSSTMLETVPLPPLDLSMYCFGEMLLVAGYGRREAAARIKTYHLVRVDRVDIAVGDVRYVDILSQRAHCAVAGPIAVDVLDEDVLRG